MSEKQQPLNLHVSHFGPMNPSLKEAVQNLNETRSVVDECSSSAPILEIPSKGDLNTMGPLAWFVITLVGTAGGIYLKAFLEELGKKTAEKFFDRGNQRGGSAEPIPPSELAGPEQVEWQSLPEFELAIVLRASSYVYAVIEFRSDDIQNLKSEGGWTQMVNEVTELIEKSVEVHEAYYALWPELQPDPIVLEIQRDEGRWRLADHPSYAPPHPPWRLERTRFHQLIFAEELQAAKSQADQSLRNARSVDDSEVKRRQAELDRRFPPGYL